MSGSLVQPSFYPLTNERYQEDEKNAAPDVNSQHSNNPSDNHFKQLSDDVELYLNNLQAKNKGAPHEDTLRDVLSEQGITLKFRLNEQLQHAQKSGEAIARQEGEAAQMLLFRLAEAENQWRETGGQPGAVNVSGCAALSAAVKKAMLGKTIPGPVAPAEAMQQQPKVPATIIRSLAMLQNCKQNDAIDAHILEVSRPIADRLSEMAAHLSEHMNLLPEGSRAKAAASLLLRVLQEGDNVSGKLLSSVKSMVEDTLNTMPGVDEDLRNDAMQKVNTLLDNPDGIIVVSSPIMMMIMVFLTLLSKEREASMEIWIAIRIFREKHYKIIEINIMASGNSKASQQLYAAATALVAAGFGVAVGGVSTFQKVRHENLAHKAQDRVTEHQSVETSINKLTPKINLPNTPPAPPAPPALPGLTNPKMKESFRVTRDEHHESPQVEYESPQTELLRRFEKGKKAENGNGGSDIVRDADGKEHTYGMCSVLQELKAERAALRQNYPWLYGARFSGSPIEPEVTHSRTPQNELDIELGSIDRRLSEITSEAESTDRVIERIIEELMAKQKAGHFEIPNDIKALIQERDRLKVITSEMNNYSGAAALRRRMSDNSPVTPGRTAAREDNLNRLTPEYVNKLNEDLNKFHNWKEGFVKFHQENTIELKKSLIEWNTTERNKFTTEARIQEQAAQKWAGMVQAATGLTMNYSQFMHASTFLSMQDNVSRAEANEETAKNFKDIFSKSDQISDKQFENVTTLEKTWVEVLQSISQSEKTMLEKLAGNLKY